LWYFHQVDLNIQNKRYQVLKPPEIFHSCHFSSSQTAFHQLL
jgi:hypothetical protein